MANVYQGYSSRCTCCNAVMDDQRVKIHNGVIDDLCAACRTVVNKAVHYHDEDVLDLETDTWGVKLGSGDIMAEDSEKVYQGYD